jgi:hypothetical protein
MKFVCYLTIRILLIQDVFRQERGYDELLIWDAQKIQAFE